MATNGIVLIKPSSVEIYGFGSESAVINPNGSVTFLNCDYIGFDNVFNSSYDNYIIDMRYKTSSTFLKEIIFNLRASGLDDSSFNPYVQQRIIADSTSVTASRFTSSTGHVTYAETDIASEGVEIFCYGPSLAQPTAIRSVGVNADTSAGIADVALTHNQSVAYDGFSLEIVSATFDGFIKVYGLVK